MWVDPDLGCHLDDYIGCDTSRSLAYVYNMDELDGNPGTECTGGGGSVETYGSRVPMIGIDYFRGPLGPQKLTDAANGSRYIIQRGDTYGPSIEIGDTVYIRDVDFDAMELPDILTGIGMSSFTYYNNGANFPTAAQTDPALPNEFYNYLTGNWRDGTPFTFGGDAYNIGSTDLVNYAFVDPPNRPGGWSMWEEQSREGDRRTIQASGPFRLLPGAVNELIVGVPWVSDVPHPGPSLKKLLDADELAQALFDNCFKIPQGPDAPDISWIELDEKLIGVLSNDIGSNNYREEYEEEGLTIPASATDKFYRFQGYQVYQLSNPNVTRAELSDPDKSILVFQSDIQDTVSNIYNWDNIENPNAEADIFVPEIKAEGRNNGIRHTFEIVDDAFREGGLVNHRKYYFTVVAYGFNNYETFEAVFGTGQESPYIESRQNVQTYTVIPRPIVYEKLNSDYGDGVAITRLDGQGVGANFLDMQPGVHDAILDGSFNGEIPYRNGRGPIDVQIYNPREVLDGEYLLVMDESNRSDDELVDSVFWKLVKTDGGFTDTIFSDVTIEQLNEQLLPQFGFTVSIGQTDDFSEFGDQDFGVIGYEEEYANGGTPWLSGMPDQGPGGITEVDGGDFFVFDPFFNYIKCEDNIIPNNVFDDDPFCASSTIGPGYFVPYKLIDNQVFTDPQFGDIPLITPAWTNSRNTTAASGTLRDCPNVDIVFTADKSKWSRSVILEGASDFYADPAFGFGVPAPGEADHFDLRPFPSVGKDDNDGDGLPDPDGAVDEDGEPLVGMGWFPGYAIDVETGKRLNIFFAENSIYSQEINDAFISLGIELGYADVIPRGGDMLFNPGSQFVVPIPGVQQLNLLNMYMGGQHALYVMDTEYDECEFLRSRIAGGSTIQQAAAMRDIMWAGFVMTETGQEFGSLADGMVPTDLTVKLRVDNPYQLTPDDGLAFSGYPAYSFKIDGLEPDPADTQDEYDIALDEINVVPNPYLGFSEYEVSQFTTTVKITNLPAKCDVTIYTLDGKFVRNYKRDEIELPVQGSDPGIRNRQISPALEWDMRNARGIPIGSGVYLIHINAPGLGERVIKWFGVNRQFDPSGL